MSFSEYCRKSMILKKQIIVQALRAQLTTNEICHSQVILAYRWIGRNVECGAFLMASILCTREFK